MATDPKLTSATPKAKDDPLGHLDEQAIRRLRIERPDLFPAERGKAYKVTARSDSPSIEARGIHDDKVGELAPGDDGWLPLDDAGKPSGPATLLPPALPTKACRVHANSNVHPGDDLLTTNTGAPITDSMQAQTDYHMFGVPPVEPMVASASKTTAKENAKADARVAG